MVTNNYLLKRIELMQEELEHLKKTVLNKGKIKPVTLRGIWKGVDFSEEEIDFAIHSWLKE